MITLLPCPFCGNEEPSFERMGTGRQSCIVICGMCGCRHESGDSGAMNGSSWNDRAAPTTPVIQTSSHASSDDDHDESAVLDNRTFQAYVNDPKRQDSSHSVYYHDCDRNKPLVKK